MGLSSLVRRNLRDPRLQLLAGALLLTALTFLVRPLAITRTGFELLAVVDITGSMNVRDYQDIADQPASRLEASKSALRELVTRLPCGSRVGLGIFTERRAFLLFAPIEVCDDYAPLDGALAALDWRMAWEGDSRIASGLFRAVEMADGLDADLVFLSDGHEAPPLPRSGGPSFDGKPGAVRGLVVGVGGRTLSQIPRYDDRGRETGFYGESDVLQENRFGPPPADAESREGYNPRNAPFGSSAAKGDEHLSSVREAYLKTLASQAGLAYVHLDRPGGLLVPVEAAARPRPLQGRLDPRPFLGAVSLALVLLAYASPLLVRWRRRLSPLPKESHA